MGSLRFQVLEALAVHDHLSGVLEDDTITDAITRRDSRRLDEEGQQVAADPSKEWLHARRRRADDTVRAVRRQFLVLAATLLEIIVQTVLEEAYRQRPHLDLPSVGSKRKKHQLSATAIARMGLGDLVDIMSRSLGPGELWDDADKLRRKRNEIVHRDRGAIVTVTAEQVVDAFNLAERVLDRLLDWTADQGMAIYDSSRGPQTPLHRDEPG